MILQNVVFEFYISFCISYVCCVAGSLEAGGLPRYPESLFVEINVMKNDKAVKHFI
jgi:hypothetical protein